MMLQLDFGDHRPLYEQIKDKMKELIISGVLKEHDKIPSVRELAATLAINPNTIQKAYKDLESEGYIYSLKSKGNFVNLREKTFDDGKIIELFESLDAVLREMRFLGVNQNQIENCMKKVYEEEKND